MNRRHLSMTVAGLGLAIAVSSCGDRSIAGPMLRSAPTVGARSLAIGTLSWLAPLGTTAADPTTFDAGAVTSISICAWSAGTCIGAPVAQFSPTPSGSAGKLTVNAAAGQYEATWSLLGTNLLTRKTYRIAAMKGATEIGSILVDVVRGRWALTRDDGTLAPLSAATELPIQFHVARVIYPIKVNEVESSGGIPGDWVELYNPSASDVDISGFVFKDNDDTHKYTLPAGSVVAAGGYYMLEEAAFGFGLGAPDMARLFDPNGNIVDSYSWTTHAATTYGRCPNGTGDFKTTTTVTKGGPNDCSKPIPVRINEVESSGGTPGDWIELINTGANSVDLSDFMLKDNDDTHIYTIPAGTTIGSHALLVFDEATFGFGLGAPDAARLFDPEGNLVDSYNWTTHATTTYGRCADGTGAFVTTVAPTKGTLNSCPSTGPTLEAWPGTNDVATVDGNKVFGGNLSGLMFEEGSGGTPDVLWGARNGPGSVFRLVFDGTIWTPDSNNGWGVGKLLHYTDGTGEPDSEDLTFTTGSSAGMYVVSERNNQANSTSRPSILRYDIGGAGTELTATNEWNLTADLPVVAANSGLEAIAWVPDSYLTSHAFFDISAGHLYNPAEYANHGDGLFFVGLEGNGVVYVYALNHATNGFKQIASFATNFPAGVMALQFDRELNQLWAICDDTCGGQSEIWVIDTTPASPTLGRFKQTHIFSRSSSMPNINNEGFALTPQSKCVGGFKPVFWADDTEDDGHAIRRASVPCIAFP